MTVPAVRFNEVINLPIFDGDLISYSLKPYRVMAVLAHFGDQHGGHYVAVLNGLDGTWIEKNDAKPAAYFDHMPEYLWTVLFLKACEPPVAAPQLQMLLQYLAA